jgi:hypothetical protein
VPVGKTIDIRIDFCHVTLQFRQTNESLTTVGVCQ